MIEYRDTHAIVVVGDTESGREAACGSATLAGCRVSDSIAFEGALERLDRQVAIDAIWLDLASDHGEPLDRLLDRLGDAAGSERYGSVISAPAALIDLVAARATHVEVLR